MPLYSESAIMEIQIDDKLLYEFQRGELGEEELSNVSISARSLIPKNNPGSAGPDQQNHGPGQADFSRLYDSYWIYECRTYPAIKIWLASRWK